MAFRNGILDTKTLDFRDATPDYFNLTACDFDWSNADPGCQLWEEKLKQVFANDQSKIDRLQEWFGYCLTADCWLEKALFLVGPTRGFKSTLLDVLTRLVGGKDAVDSPAPEAFGNSFNLETMTGKALITISEGDSTSSKYAGAITRFIKTVTGQDSLKIDRKFKKAISGGLTAKVIWQANAVPTLFDSSGAMLNRILPLTTDFSALGIEDRELRSKLNAEILGITHWALRGLARLRTHGEFTATDCLREDLLESTLPLKGFVEQNLEIDWLSYDPWSNGMTDSKSKKLTNYTAYPDIFSRYSNGSYGHLKSQYFAKALADTLRAMYPDEARRLAMFSPHPPLKSVVFGHEKTRYLIGVKLKAIN